MELVDDIYGKIHHVLVYCEHPADALFVEGLVNAFDEEVIISVAYPEIKKYVYGPLKHLQKISREHENVMPFEIDGYHTPWVQDAIHSFDNKTLMPLARDSLVEVFDDEEKRILARGKNLLDSPHWKEFGFRVAKNKHRVSIPGGQIMHCGSDVYLDNDAWLNFYENVRQYSFDLSDNARYNLLKGDLVDKDEAKRLFLKKIKYLRGDATPEFIGLAPDKASGIHMDVYYHPDAEGAFISKIKNPFEYDEDILGEYKIVEKLLDRFNEQERNKNRTEIPMVFPREHSMLDITLEITLEGYAPEDSVCIMSEHKIPFYTPLNAQYEIFRQDDGIIKRAYVPAYPFLHEPIFRETYLETKAAFESRGFEVREVPFYLIDAWGGLRCATKVLERTGTKDAITACSSL